MHAVSLQDPNGVAIVEAALLIEAGAAKRFDRLIVVTCSLEQRAERFAKRQTVDLETARGRLRGGWRPSFRTRKRSKLPIM